jgi:hypothetical protein
MEGGEKNRASDIENEHALPLAFLLKTVLMLLLLAGGVAFAAVQLMQVGWG